MLASLGRPLKCVFFIRIEKPCSHKSLRKEHFQPHAISGKSSVAGVGYPIKVLYVKAAAGPKLALAMVLLA